MVRIRPKPEKFSEPTNMQKHRKSRRLLNFLFLITSLKSESFQSQLLRKCFKPEVFTTGDWCKSSQPKPLTKRRDATLTRNFAELSCRLTHNHHQVKGGKISHKKSRIKATKQKQCISNPQNDNLKKLKNRKRYRWLHKNKLTFFSRETCQGFVA